MKFNDGYWLLREGVTATYAKEAFAVETSDSTVSVAALSRPVEHRGSHLNTPTVTVDLSSPAQDVVTVRASRRVRTTPPEPDFQLHTTLAAGRSRPRAPRPWGRCTWSTTRTPRGRPT